MTVTILIPTWNAATYIKRALDSVVATGYAKFEVLVMDNLSDDGTTDLVNNYGDSRVRCISQKDKSMYEALNRGIAQAKGEVISYFGADDQASKNGIHQALELFKNPAVQWVVGEGTFLYEEGEQRTEYHQLPKSVTLQQVAYANPLISPSIFFRKAFFKKVGGFNEQYRYAADYDLWLRFAAASQPAVLRESASTFSYNGSNISSKNKITLYQETIAILRSTKVPGVTLARYLNILRMQAYIAYNHAKRLISK